MYGTSWNKEKCIDKVLGGYRLNYWLCTLCVSCRPSEPSGQWGVLFF